MLARLLAVLLAAVWLAAPAIAEVNQVRFARQLGLGYLQFYIMEDKKLVEKHARQLGLGAVTTQWLALGTPTALNDALASSLFPVLSYFLKPATSTLIEYMDGGMLVTVKYPESLVVAWRSRPEVFLTVTLAFGTTAPLGSLTKPEIEPKSDCAKPLANASRQRASSFARKEPT